jgi:hypothetical protein
MKENMNDGINLISGPDWSFVKNPRLAKYMKKSYGKHLAYQIAFGRKLLKILEKNANDL